MRGATPLYLSAGFIIEEGLPLADLERVADSMAQTARAAGVVIATGDTKVVNRGAADKLFINTAGVGVVPAGVEVGANRVRPGDVVLVSGPVGDHGIAIMTQREGLRFQSPLVSDCAPLNGLVAAMLAAAPGAAAGAVHCLRDATRGGLASVLNELAQASGVSMTITEKDVPVLPAVKAASEMLGLDPLYIANEGVAVAIVAPGDADAVIAAARADDLGSQAAIVGEVGEPPVAVRAKSGLGATRPLIMLAGDQLPRIC